MTRQQKPQTNDREILRTLGRALREAAADPVNEERRRVHQLVDSRQKSRPFINISQEPWHELNVNGELDLHCTDPFCRGIEWDMRATLYKWRHYLPNMYHISMSPWVDFRKGCENVRDRFVFAWKPNPAPLAHDHWDADFIRRDMEEKLAIAADHGCVVAIYLKDISTVHGQPQRLTDWDRIAKECVAKYAV